MKDYPPDTTETDSGVIIICLTVLVTAAYAAHTLL